MNTTYEMRCKIFNSVMTLLLLLLLFILPALLPMHAWQQGLSECVLL